MAMGRRRGHLLGLAIALTFAALAAGASSAAAATKDFSLAVAPDTVPSGRLVELSATLKNLTATQQLGSANVAPPAGYAVQSIVSLSRPAPATASLAGGVVQLRNLSLAPQASVTVTFMATTPCSPGATALWTSVVAKQANDFNGQPGNNLTLDPSRSSLDTTTVGACVPCPEDESCETDLSAPQGSALRLLSEPLANEDDAGLLTISLPADVLDCAGYSERSAHSFRFDAPPNRGKVGEMTYSSSTRPVSGNDPLEVCFGSPSPFVVKAKTVQTTAVVDGQLLYVGRLPNCIGLAPPPCVTDRDNTLRRISFRMAPGDPHSR